MQPLLLPDVARALIRAAVGLPPSCLLLALIWGRVDSLTARLCLAAMTCALISRRLVAFGLCGLCRILLLCCHPELHWTLRSWLGTVPCLGWVAPLCLVGGCLHWSQCCSRCGILTRSPGSLLGFLSKAPVRSLCSSALLVCSFCPLAQTCDSCMR